MSRSDQWDEDRFFEPVILDPESNPDFEKIRGQAPKREAEDGGILWNIIGSSKELIFRLEGEEARFQCISFSIDARHLDLALGKSFEIFGFDGKEDVKEILAVALSEDVSVYPDDDESAVVLARLHAELLRDGFETDFEGETTRLMYTGPRALDLSGSEPLETYTPTASISPADLLALRGQALTQKRALEEAHRTLAVLNGAISELRERLEADTRNEHALQSTLTSYPILFGLEYGQVIPKHRLGGEYEMDYALVRHSGLVDLVEIEASTHDLYTRGG